MQTAVRIPLAAVLDLVVARLSLAVASERSVLVLNMSSLRLLHDRRHSSWV